MEEVLRFSRFFYISVFTFETSIVGYAATFPIGESKFFDNFAKQNITPVLRDAEASSPTVAKQLADRKLFFLLINSNYSCLPLWGRGTARGGRGLTCSQDFLISPSLRSKPLSSATPPLSP